MSIKEILTARSTRQSDQKTSTRNERTGRNYGPGEGHDLAHLHSLQIVIVSHWQGGGLSWDPGQVVLAL